MTDKTNFAPDEWKLLLACVKMAGIAFYVAEPPSLRRNLKEVFASSNDLSRAKLDFGANELVKAVAADFETLKGRSLRRAACLTNWWARIARKSS